MKNFFSKYSRYIFISLALCSASGLWAMEERPSQFNTPRQIRLAQLDEYRAQLIKMIWIIKKDPSCDENTRANLSFFEESLKNVERELRLLLDPDIQNSAVTIAYPIFQYIPIPLPMTMPMHPGMLPLLQPILDQSQSTEIDPIVESAPTQSTQTQDRSSEIQPTPEAPKLTTQQDQIGGILKRPSHPDQNQTQISLLTEKPVKTYASALATPAKPAPTEHVQQQRTTTVVKTDTSHAPKVVFKNRLESQHQVETSKFKKTTTQQSHFFIQAEKHADTQKEKKKSPEKQQPQVAPSATTVKERVVLTTPVDEKKHKAKKSEKTKTKTPKREEESAKEPEQEVVAQPSEHEEEDVAEEESSDSHKSESQTKEKPKPKQKSQKQKKKSPTQTLGAAAASSNPQSEQPQSAQSDESRLFNLWKHGIEILKQLPSIEDDSEKRSVLSQAISLFEQVFSLQIGRAHV